LFSICLGDKQPKSDEKRPSKKDTHNNTSHFFVVFFYCAQYGLGVDDKGTENKTSRLYILRRKTKEKAISLHNKIRERDGENEDSHHSRS